MRRAGRDPPARARPELRRGRGAARGARRLAADRARSRPTRRAPRSTARASSSGCARCAARPWEHRRERASASGSATGSRRGRRASARRWPSPRSWPLGSAAWSSRRSRSTTTWRGSRRPSPRRERELATLRRLARRPRTGAGRRRRPAGPSLVTRLETAAAAWSVAPRIAAMTPTSDGAPRGAARGARHAPPDRRVARRARAPAARPRQRRPADRRRPSRAAQAPRRRAPLRRHRRGRAGRVRERRRDARPREGRAGRRGAVRRRARRSRSPPTRSCAGCWRACRCPDGHALTFQHARLRPWGLVLDDAAYRRSDGQRGARDRVAAAAAVVDVAPAGPARPAVARRRRGLRRHRRRDGSTPTTAGRASTPRGPTSTSAACSRRCSAAIRSPAAPPAAQRSGCRSPIRPSGEGELTLRGGVLAATARRLDDVAAARRHAPRCAGASATHVSTLASFDLHGEELDMTARGQVRLAERSRRRARSISTSRSRRCPARRSSCAACSTGCRGAPTASATSGSPG